MSWLLWIVVAWVFLGALLFVSRIGKERKVITANQAPIGLLEYAAIIVLIIIGGGLLG